MRIPFNQPSQIGKEFEYIKQAITEMHLSGDGMFTKKCHTELEAIVRGRKALLTTSCTHALEMTALLLNIQAGDEVIIPAFTFVSTVNAFVLRGARPIFVDIRPDTLNLDETQLETHITPRTRAIVVVHYAGVGCEMDAILETAGRYNIPVVEDNAHGLFGMYKGRPLGSMGCMATQSFHETKNITCGEGGALIINDPQYIERAEIIREKGTNRSQFFRGQVDKYTWADVGSSYLPSEILAAFLFAQLENWEEIQTRRKTIWDYYDQNLSSWAQERNIRLPYVPAHCAQSYHMFYMLLPGLEERQTLISYLKKEEISAVFHYLPLHLSDMGKRFGGRAGDCPVTEDISDRLLRLPFYNNMTEQELERVVLTIKEFYR